MIFDKRFTKWPFNQVIGDAICEAIASGARITKLSKEFPSYNVICRWRRENQEFNRAILAAYADRADLFNLNKFSDFKFLKKIMRGV